MMNSTKIEWVPVRCPVCGKRLLDKPKGTRLPPISVYCKGRECRTARIINERK